MIIAIDGPAAAGKSTLARALARKLDLTFLDTGAMYRAVTLAVQRAGVDAQDEQACARVARSIAFTFDDAGGVRIDGEPGEPAIRGPEVTRDVSAVSAHPAVRRAIVPHQRAAASGRGVVAEGRDTTTVVFPDADHKFFLLASTAERARRRARQEGRPESVEQYRAEIERRDALDRSRPDSPLRQARDAVCVDTEGVTPEEVLARLLEVVEAKP